MDFTRDDFLNFWPGGYQEQFGNNYPFKDKIFDVIQKHASGKTILDIGCGSGFWTMKWLRPLFDRVICVDLIPKPDNLDAEYIQLPEADYSLPGVEDSSVDFVFSFGLFCHLSNSAVETYLKSIQRVMSSGATGLLMFANILKILERHREKPFANMALEGWFYSDLETIQKAIKNAGLVFISDTIPDFRDSLVLIKKEV